MDYKRRLEQRYPFFDYKDFYDFVAAKNFNTHVEVGCWLGYSTVYLAKRVSHLYAVDLWTLTSSRQAFDADFIDLQLIIGDEIFKTFKENLKINQVKNVTPLRCMSDRAAELFTSVDFVFIDADHSYNAVKKDIAAWLPKTKMLAGHDYNHLSVKRAVDEIGEPKTMGNVWYYEDCDSLRNEELKSDT